MPSNLYRVLWFSGLGYVVYRHCFDTDGDEIRDRIGAATHKTATFVTEAEAEDYARYRNRLMDENGNDALPHFPS